MHDCEYSCGVDARVFISDVQDSRTGYIARVISIDRVIKHLQDTHTERERERERERGARTHAHSLEYTRSRMLARMAMIFKPSRLQHNDWNSPYKTESGAQRTSSSTSETTSEETPAFLRTIMRNSSRSSEPLPSLSACSCIGDFSAVHACARYSVESSLTERRRMPDPVLKRAIYG